MAPVAEVTVEELKKKERQVRALEATLAGYDKELNETLKQSRELAANVRRLKIERRHLWRERTQNTNLERFLWAAVRRVIRLEKHYTSVNVEEDIQDLVRLGKFYPLRAKQAIVDGAGELQHRLQIKHGGGLPSLPEASSKILGNTALWLCFHALPNATEEEPYVSVDAAHFVVVMRAATEKRKDTRAVDEALFEYEELLKVKDSSVPAPVLEKSPEKYSGGTVQLIIVGAEDLPAMDTKLIGKGTSDPYVKVFAAGKREAFKTEVQKKTLAPTWNAFCQFRVSPQEESIDLIVYDYDMGSGDDPMGCVTLNLIELGAEDQVKDLQLQMTPSKKYPKAKGTLHVKIGFYDGDSEPPPMDRKFQIDIFEAQDLLAMDTKLIGKGASDPYVKIMCGNKELFKTDKQKKTLNPEWNASGTISVSESEKEIILALFDSDFGSGDDPMGRVTLKLQEFVDKGTAGSAEQWYNVEPQPECKKAQGRLRARCTFLDGITEPPTPANAAKPSRLAKLHIFEAKDLLAMDTKLMGKGTSDPYIKVLVAKEKGEEKKEKKEVFRTEKKTKTLDPQWDVSCVFPVEEDETKVILALFDSDVGSGDDPMGKVTLNLQDFADGAVEKWFDVEPQKECKKAKGQVRAWFAFLDSATDSRSPSKESGRKIQLDIFEAKDLLAMDTKLMGKGTSDPYIKVLLGAQNKEVFKTEKQSKTLNPKWDASCSFFVRDDEKELVLALFDYDMGSGDDPMGRVTLKLQDVEQGPIQKWFQVESQPECKNAKGQVHARLTFLDGTEASSQQAAPAGGEVHLSILEGRDLLAMDTKLVGKGTSDPYVKVLCGPQQREVFKTETKTKTLDPQWNASCKFQVAGEENQVVLALFDSDKGNKDDPMGRVTLKLEDFQNEKAADRWVDVEAQPECKKAKGQLCIRMNFVPAIPPPMAPKSVKPPSQQKPSVLGDARSILLSQIESTSRNSDYLGQVPALRNLMVLDENLACSLVQFPVKIDNIDKQYGVAEAGAMALKAGFLQSPKVLALARIHDAAVGELVEAEARAMSELAGLDPALAKDLEQSANVPGGREGRLRVLLKEQGFNPFPCASQASLAKFNGGSAEIHIFEAKDLLAMDTALIGKGKSDPYVKVMVGSAKREVFKTETKSKTLEPKWDASCSFAVSAAEQDIVLCLFDSDFGSGDDPMGQIPLNITDPRWSGNLAGIQRNEQWFDVQPQPECKKAKGKVRVKISFTAAPPPPQTLGQTLHSTVKAFLSSRCNEATKISESHGRILSKDLLARAQTLEELAKVDAGLAHSINEACGKAARESGFIQAEAKSDSDARLQALKTLLEDPIAIALAQVQEADTADCMRNLQELDLEAATAIEGASDRLGSPRRDKVIRAYLSRHGVAPLGGLVPDLDEQALDPANAGASLQKTESTALPPPEEPPPQESTPEPPPEEKQIPEALARFLPDVTGPSLTGKLIELSEFSEIVSKLLLSRAELVSLLDAAEEFEKKKQKKPIPAATQEPAAAPEIAPSLFSLLSKRVVKKVEKEEDELEDEAPCLEE